MTKTHNKMPKRVCWKGYVRKPGTERYSSGSCIKKSKQNKRKKITSAQKHRGKGKRKK